MWADRLLARASSHLLPSVSPLPEPRLVETGVRGHCLSYWPGPPRAEEELGPGSNPVPQGALWKVPGLGQAQAKGPLGQP